MAKPPSKRRGITLGSRADSAAALDQLTEAVAAADIRSADQSAIQEMITELRHLGAEQEAHWQRQETLMQQQIEQLARQSQRFTARVGLLLTLLVVVGAGALGYHFWPGVQGVFGDLQRVSSNVDRIGPELQAMREQVASLVSDVGQVDRSVADVRGDVSNVRSDVSDVRSDLVTLSKTVTTVRTGKTKPARADSSVTVRAFPRQASLTAEPYRVRHRMIPW